MKDGLNSVRGVRWLNHFNFRIETARSEGAGLGGLIGVHDSEYLESGWLPILNYTELD